MEFFVISTGSSGNCYLLKTQKECLVIENGVPFKEVKKALNFNIIQIAGNLSSHQHLDHYKYTKEYRNAGIPTFCPFEQDKTDVVKKIVKFGGFTIQCFPLVHDVDCYGFYIKHKECGKCLFITDTEYVPQIFRQLNINHIFVECNYISNMVDRSLPNYEHKLRHHMSLETCQSFVQANATDYLKTVVLLHMGVETCDPQECVEEVQKCVKNANVDFAEKGKEFSLTDECPF